MASIPFVDLKAQYRSIRDDIDAAVASVIAETSFIGGSYARAFEDAFAQFCGARHCVGVGNGTDALYIAFRALGVGPGDDVLVPANTFIATSEAVTMAGASVVFVDCDPHTYCIDVDDAARRITKATKAIIPVHLYGQPADLSRIREFADAHRLKVVQDCAQSHGARIEGRQLAEFGDILCFSFYPGKNLGAYGDAGAVVTNDEQVARTVRMIANHGRISKYDHEFEGVNSRLDGIQGAILGVKLKHLDRWTGMRRANADTYTKLLAGVTGVVAPVVREGVRHVYHLYVVRVDDREGLAARLSEKGVATGVHYPIALPNLTAYAHLGHKPGDFPVASEYQAKILSLPMYPELTEEMIGSVVTAIGSLVA